MKRLFSLLLLVTMLIAGSQVFASETNPPSKDQVRQRFEQRLNLSEKQKAKAKKIHQKGQEQMKPVMVQINEKREEIKKLKSGTSPDKATQEKIKQNMDELKVLEQKAREIRKANSQEFEKILNKKQKNELEKMKAEGRANFHKHHPPRPPFNMFPPAKPPVQPPVEK